MARGVEAEAPIRSFLSCSGRAEGFRGGCRAHSPAEPPPCTRRSASPSARPRHTRPRPARTRLRLWDPPVQTRRHAGHRDGRGQDLLRVCVGLRGARMHGGHGVAGVTGSPGSRGRRGPRSPTRGLAWPWWASRILALCSGHGVALSRDARPSAPGPRLGAVPPGRGGRVCVEPRPVPFDQQVLSKLELAVTVPRTPEGRKLVRLRPVLSPGLLAVLGPRPCRGGCRRGAPLAPQPGLWVLGVWALSASSPRAPAAGPPVACWARGPCRVPSAFNIQSWGGGGGASAPWDSLSKAVRFHSG